MRKKKSRKVIGIVLGCLVLVAIGMSAFLLQRYHWNLTLSTEHFSETNKVVNNPNRGFYRIYGFRIKDDQEDWASDVRTRMKGDRENALALIEINIQEYRASKITEDGMQNIEALFRALSEQNKQYIVRFLYDWNGENLLYEPQNIQIIVDHMKQLEPVFKEYADHIFTLQGLFTGNCGEMNSTQYLDEASLRTLMQTLASVSDSNTYLSVRTPMQWRQIMQAADIAKLQEDRAPYIERLGLFNDGMLGNWSDYGTYGTQSKSEAGLNQKWARDEELEFQDDLCRNVPNGGEVIVDNEYNDLNNAIADFNQMHVSYLNEEYDQAVLEKWSNSVIHTDDCFDGMDGLSYMKARLGYRLVLRECRMQQDFWKDTLQVELDIANVGFAPIYKACEASLVFVPKTESGRRYSVSVDQNLSELAGGNETDRIETIRTTISLHKLSREDYDVYFQLRDQATGEIIYFANEQDCEPEGYKIGQLAQ